MHSLFSAAWRYMATACVRHAVSSHRGLNSRSSEEYSDLDFDLLQTAQVTTMPESNLAHMANVDLFQTTYAVEQVQ